MISPDIRHAYEAIATHNLAPDKLNVVFDLVLGMDKDLEGKGASGNEDGFICEARNPLGAGSVHRAHFLDGLAKLIPDGVAHFGKRMAGYEDNGEGGVLLTFTDGTTAVHAALIGCDGVKSQTRALLLAEGHDAAAAHPVFTGKYAYRALLPMNEAAAMLGDYTARNANMYIGRGSHMMTFPVNHGHTMNGAYAPPLPLPFKN